MDVKLLQRLITRGGPAYMPGEVIAVSDDDALAYVEKGLAVFADAAPRPGAGPAPAPPPVSDRPPMDRMIKRGDAVRK